MDSAFMIGAIVGSLVAGLRVGAIPAITGAVKGKLGLGLAGLGCCVVGAFILGLILAIPICAVFMFLIFRGSKAQTPPPYDPYQQNPYGQPPYNQPPPYNGPYQQPQDQFTHPGNLPPAGSSNPVSQEPGSPEDPHSH